MKGQIAKEKVKFWLDRELDNLELLAATYVTHSFSPHMHEGFAIGVIESGVESFSCRGSNYNAPQGSVVVINPGEVHTGSAALKTGWTYRMLYPGLPLVRQASGEFSSRSTLYFPEPVIQDKQLAGIIYRLHVFLESPASAIERESPFLWALARLIERHAGERQVPRPLGSEHTAVRRALEYLEANYSSNVSLKDLSGVTGLSPFHLLRVFQKSQGFPPHSYLIQIRVRQAKRLLSAGVPIAQAATDAGFSDQSHMNRYFKRFVGVTPGHYIKNNSNIVQYDSPVNLLDY